jgi:phage/plasmid-like protein (TIGR03299 family)
MAAGIESTDNMVYLGATPWHNLGTLADTNDKYNWKEFAGKANLLWGVRKVPLCTTEYANRILQESKIDPKITEVQPNTDGFAVIREDNNAVLGIVGSSYTPLSNIDAFSFFQNWLDTKEMALHTGGTLYSGRKIWVLAQFTKDPLIKIAGNDDVAKFVLLSSSHDGTSSVRFGTSLTRVVCANTLSLAHKSGQLIRTIHSSQVKKNLDNLKSILDVANQEFSATADKLRYLSSRQINTKDLQQYVKVVLDLDNKEEKDISTRSKNIMKKIFELMDAPNQSMKEISGTYYAAYNAYNTYLVHNYGRNESSRIDSLWFGINKAKNDKALDLALKMAS